MICITTVSFGLPLLFNYFTNANIDLSMLASVPPVIMNIILALACTAVWGVSQWVSIRIFSKKDL